jgi:hypothetical protein
MTNCDTCGKLMASGTGELQCRACRAEARAAAKALAVEYAVAVEAEPEVPVVIEAPPCVRCRKHDAMEDSHFCLGCQLELVNSLGDAAEELFRTPPPPLPPISSPASLMRDVEEKRQRTATSHMNVVGGTRLR